MLVHVILFLWGHYVRSRGMNRCRKIWEKAVEEGCALGMCRRPKYFPQPCVSLWHAIRLSYPTVDLCLIHTRGWDRDKRVCVCPWYGFTLYQIIFCLWFSISLLFLFLFYRSHSCSRSCRLIPPVLFSFSRPPRSIKTFTFALHLHLHTFFFCQSDKVHMLFIA